MKKIRLGKKKDEQPVESNIDAKLISEVCFVLCTGNFKRDCKQYINKGCISSQELDWLVEDYDRVVGLFGAEKCNTCTEYLSKVYKMYKKYEKEDNRTISSIIES